VHHIQTSKFYSLAQKLTTQHNCKNPSAIHLAKQNKTKHEYFCKANTTYNTKSIVVSKSKKLNFDHPNPCLSQTWNFFNPVHIRISFCPTYTKLFSITRIKTYNYDKIPNNCHAFQCRCLQPSMPTHICHKLNNIKLHKFNASYPNCSLSRVKVPWSQITTWKALHNIS